MVPPLPFEDVPDSQPTTRSPEPRNRPQFDLKRVFAVVTIAALLFGAIHWFGLAGTIVLSLILGMAFVGYAIPTSPAAKSLSACGGLLIGTLALACLLPAVSSGPVPRVRSQCNNNLKHIGLGLQTYADVYKCFPPSCIVDKDGRPLHSWRVLILPYIEQKALYAQYDFDEAWDGPHNRLLASKMPRCFHCDKDGPPGGTTTSYVAVTGPDSLLGDGSYTFFGSVKDGTTNTLAVVEIKGSGINWMEPRDLPYAALSQGINARTGMSISSHHPGGAFVVFGDGHTGYLQDSMPLDELEALGTKAGGEAISGDY